MELQFTGRHIGPRDHEIESMLTYLGGSSLSELVNQTIPESIRLEGDLDFPSAHSEYRLIRRLEDISSKNQGIICTHPF